MRVARPAANPSVARLMTRTAIRLALLALTLGLCACALSPPPARPADQITLLISIDGFRWDYLEVHDAPVVRALAADGVRARRMNASFPSKTFPNHYTLVTGLRPGTHGIVANWFWDPATSAMFSMARVESHWWEGGEPIWVTAEKQGVRSACLFWPGSESEIRGRRPAFFRPFDKALPNDARVDGLLAYLDRPPAQRPRLGTLYFDAVDDAGHRFGPHAPETAVAIREVDAAIGRLLAGLERLGLRDRTNVVVVSDHGMMSTSIDRVVFFEDLMDVSQVQIESDGPNGGVRPLPESGLSASVLVDRIRAKAPPHLTVYLREDMPARFHYRDHERIPPVVLVCDDHWVIERKSTWGARRPTFSLGNHGWDPASPDMGAFFLAQGPAIRRGAVIGEFDNIHVYPLLCRLLDITPAPVEGDDRLAREVLR